MALGELIKLKEVAYGLVEATVEWYISSSLVLEEHGWRRWKSDRCCWILIDQESEKQEATQGVMKRSDCAAVAATGGHVDDFVSVGREGNKVWETAWKRLQDDFRWNMWDYDNFIQFGVRVEYRKGGGFLLSKANSSLN